MKVDIIDTIPQRFKNGIICCAELMVIRPDPEMIDPYYLLLYLKTKFGFQSIQSCIRGQTAHIYPKDISRIKIPILSIEEFDNIKDEIENLKHIIKSKSQVEANYHDSLKKLLMNFT